MRGLQCSALLFQRACDGVAVPAGLQSFTFGNDVSAISTSLGVDFDAVKAGDLSLDYSWQSDTSVPAAGAAIDRGINVSDADLCTAP